MFRRTFTTKSASAIKSSEWRRTRDRMPQGLLPYLSTVTKVSAERIAFAADKATATLYWSVPDNQLVAMEPGNVLDDVPPNTVLPSLVVCWKAPGGIPTFCTPPQVMEKICQAADLMAPGIFGHLPDVQPGQVVGVALLGNPRCVLAIGIALMDTHTIATQRKGKAVRIVHFYGDNLWEKCGKPKVPEIAPAADDQPSTDDVDQPEPSSADPREPTDPAPSAADEPLSDPLIPPFDSLAVTDPSSDTDSADPPAAAATDPDAATQLAFLYALLDLTALPPADLANQLPISGSTFHSRFMQPYAKSIDMKTTRWKKLAKFLKAMEKEFGASSAGDARLVAVKEIRGGEMQITAVNAGHAALQEAKARRDDEDEPRKTNKKKFNEKLTSNERVSAAGDTCARVTVTPLFQPIAPLAFLFPNLPRDTYLTRAQVTQALDVYVTQHALTHAKDGRLVRVDDHLAKYAPKPPASPAPAPAAGGRTTRPAWEEEEERARAPPVHYAKRDAISASVIAAMRKSYRVTDPRTDMDDVRRGEFRKIEIATEKRQGRKVVTLVKHLAQVMVVGTELQGELSTRCASSVSVGEMSGVPAAMGPVVQVQGDQIKFLRTWVAEKGVAHLCEFIGKK